MISFNKKAILNSKLTPSECRFDATLRKMVFANRDRRDSPRIDYTINGETYSTYVDRNITYNLPQIDTYYDLTFKGFPRGAKYKGFSGSTRIFQNNLDCRDFNYGSKDSNSISGYKGSKNEITIPDKYNMINTITAHITEFPNVVGDIKINTGQYLNKFWIKDNRITEFNIGCDTFTPMAAQFKDLTNLTKIVKKSAWEDIPNECFYNCSKLKTDDEFFKNTKSLGVNSLYGVNFPTLRFAGTSTENSGLSNAAVFTSASTINGYDEKSLYYNSTVDTISGFVNVRESEWCSSPAADDAYVVPRGINTEGYTVEMFGCPVPKYCSLIECSDPNIMGFKYRALSSWGDTANVVGYRVHIPQGVKTPYYEDYSTIVNGRKFFIVHHDFYFNDNDENDLTDNSILEMSAFDRKGHKSTIIRKRWDGDDKPTFVTKVAYFTTQNNTTLTLNGTVFETKVPAGRLYIYGDMFNIPKFTFTIMDNKVNDSWTFKVVNTADLNRTSDPYIYWIDVSEYIDINKILANGSWPTYIDSLSKFYLYVYNTNADGITMTGNPGGTPGVYYTLDKEKITFNYGNVSPEDPDEPEIDDSENEEPTITNGTPDFYVKKAFFTTVDNSTLTLNGSTYETNVPKYRLYFHCDSKNCPKIRFKFYIVKAPDATSSKWRLETVTRDQIVTSNLSYISLLDFDLTEEEIMNYVYTTYNKYLPYLEVGYANNYFEDDFTPTGRWLTLDYLNSSGKLTGSKLTYTTEEEI